MVDAPDILKRIVAQKWNEIEYKKTLKSSLEMQTSSLERTDSPRGFVNAIRHDVQLRRLGVIAEIKRASPSKGVIRRDLNPSQIAKSYQLGGASCLSVLTDEVFFRGSNQNLTEARDGCELPVLRKDFIVDPYQIYEAATIGADCILLIASILNLDELKQMSELARSIGLDTLVEVHSQVELDAVLSFNPPLIGINNRDLHTFDVSINVTLDLLESIPEGTLIISESGIKNRNDVLRLTEAGVDGFLVGEAFMRHDDPGQKLEELFPR
ncbi:MAG: indole-3-glycerol phosphate synthase TrpC [Candidatus Azotimanducaceae bacterium]|uniref:Indole-3-glycerol phosphate synthase n=1 Tax=OM182 bacterium TaxID=2510334 RepID=A0A520S3L5_9GAMM|nr:indole-3-glycerol-phosphate synthase [Gammaproteobacteria bacterium]OUV67588.1 MAG: indole-3-glycerol-phosphate synthase [Gammaproteobacteria bacterium TMED133]RZO77053.1 MAG: indole-3-glycerol phosphate synthase TrpC [OM182 bacterium]